MTKYNKSFVYKLVTDCNDSVYIGSACGDPKRRFLYHKINETCACKDHFTELGWEHVRMIILEKCNVNDNFELTVSFAVLSVIFGCISFYIYKKYGQMY